MYEAVLRLVALMPRIGQIEHATGIDRALPHFFAGLGA